MALDLSKLSTKDLEYMAAGQIDKVSDAGLAQLAAMSDVMAGEAPPARPASRTGLQDFGRGAGLMLRGMAPVATGAGAGFLVGGPPGALAGALTLPLAELATQGINLALPKDYQIPSPQAGVENLMTSAGLPVPETMPERALVAGSSALSGTASQLPGLARLGQSASSELGRGISASMAQAPGRQLAAAVPSGVAAQSVAEATGSPIAGMLAGMGTAAPFGMGVKTPKVSPRDEIAARSSAAFAQAEKSGIAFDPTKFNANMAAVAVDLRKEGYTPTGYPKIESAFKELTSTTQPKDFTELQALRKMIANAQASADPSERRLAGILKDQFDNYVSNAPAADIIGANTKEGINAWKTARTEYSRMMKGDVFDEMLERAKLDVSKFTQSGAENSLAQQLRQLAKNKNKMRLFTASEQEAIKAAAKGSTTQNLLKFYGRFAPTGPVSAMFTGGASVINPYLGIPVAAGALASRYGATQMRKGSVEDLANLMRQGNAFRPQTAMPGAPAATAMRGLLSSPTEEDASKLYGGQ
jgi:hypothetical protein